MNCIRVLIVKDEGIVATDIQERLTSMGYQAVGWADNAARAMELTEIQRPDIVLMDIRLPGSTDGILAAKEINTRFQIPVVFLAAYSEEATLERAKLAQPFGYILKPFNDRELKSTIEIALYRHKTERTIRRLNRILDVLGQVNQAIMRLPSRDGSIGGIISVVEDLTERKWAEQERTRIDAQLRQSQKMEALGNLAGGIAHDFNNILSIIIGNTEIALWKTEKGSTEAHSMNLVLHAARRAADLVQQILTFSHRHKPEKKPVKVAHVLQEVLKRILASLPSTIEINQDIASKAVVLADGSQLHQVILNLCSYAAHAMQDKGGILDVHLVDVVLNGQAIPNNADPARWARTNFDSG